MRILMLSWEYPPKMVGGLGRHVHALSRALAAAGHSVTVVSRHGDHADGTPAETDEIIEGVRVVRVHEDPPLVPFSELMAWTLAMNHGLTRAALRIVNEEPFDVIHCHDWLVAHAGKTLKDVTGLPLIATVHATEAGRHQGWLPGPMNQAIHSVEWWLTFEARRVITCSSHMRWEVTRLFDLPDKVDVIPNGIDVAHWEPSPRSVRAARSRYAGEGPLLLFAGRLEYEKGVQTVLRALPRLRRRHPGLHLVVAGVGTQEDSLRALTKSLRVSGAVTFTGYLEPVELAALAAASDVAVVPSIYEPFGLVALEAAAVGTPVAVADTGGLREFVEHGTTGLRFTADDVPGLADAVTRLLRDEVLSRRLVHQAREVLARDYTWPAVAIQTVHTYATAITEERTLQATQAGRAGGRGALRVVVRDGNLLTDTAPA